MPGLIDDVDLLYELGTLRFVERTWRQFGGLPFANVSEHSFRTIFVALAIAVREGADTSKVIQLVLVHDVHESRTGDANYLQRMYRRDNSSLVWDDIAAASTLGAHLSQLRSELAGGETLEARIVKDADSLDCDLELREMKDRGSTISDVLRETRIAAGRRLHTETARSMLAAIEERDSNAWHLEARNRLTSGDWNDEPTP